MRELITTLTTNFVTTIYNYIILNAYTILSNVLLVLLLLFIPLAPNTLLLYIVPVFLFLVSMATYFNVISYMREHDCGVCSIRKYFSIFLMNLSSNWKVFLIYLIGIAVITIDALIVYAGNGITYFIIPLIITMGFILGSMFFVFLILSDPQSKSMKPLKLIQSAIILSYKLPFITFINFILTILSLVSILYMPLIYIAFGAGLINYIIIRNIGRKFSVSLYFEQI
ncbi:MAG: hypothetical protein LBN22_08510 [Clostridiales Family XIII bacterium]|nr:hypothetical protein [Clostridiales Family XIII bacterium]